MRWMTWRAKATHAAPHRWNFPPIVLRKPFFHVSINYTSPRREFAVAAASHVNASEHTTPSPHPEMPTVTAGRPAEQAGCHAAFPPRKVIRFWLSSCAQAGRVVRGALRAGALERRSGERGPAEDVRGGPVGPDTETVKQWCHLASATGYTKDRLLIDDCVDR